MTTADKFGIAISIGFTVALIAFAMSFSATGKSAPVELIPAPSAPMPVDIPATEEEVSEEMIVEETPATEEEVSEEETPEEEMSEELPIEEEPETEEEYVDE
ncbi:MAG: hypothetical protein ACKO7Y_06155 [Candidatus Nitrosotenuis sp.]